MLERKRRFSIDIRSQRLSRNIQRKVQLSLIGSPLPAFQWPCLCCFYVQTYKTAPSWLC